MQQRDHYKSVEHFLDDKSFQRWVLEGDDPYRWEDWLSDNPQSAPLVEEAREWLLALRVPEEMVSRTEMQAALQNTWDKIRAMEEPRIPIRLSFWKHYGEYVAASVLMLGVLLGGLYSVQLTNKPVPGSAQQAGAHQRAMIEKTNTTEHPLLIMLSDGSSVLLQPHSQLRYPHTFDQAERKVYLSGDGFFEISKNPQRPFYVYANELVTKVVGTSFRIKAFTSQKNVEVVVRTGKVNVTSRQAPGDSEKQGVLLLPNQGVRFGRESGVFEKIDDLTQEKNLTRDLSNIEKLSFEFTDVPVSQIFRTIEQAYLVTIDFPTDKLANCYLTTSLSDQPLAEKLKVICESLGRRTGYTLHENKITIHTEGCN
jgi:transmembrane sensor